MSDPKKDRPSRGGRPRGTVIKEPGPEEEPKRSHLLDHLQVTEEDIRRQSGREGSYRKTLEMPHQFGRLVKKWVYETGLTEKQVLLAVHIWMHKSLKGLKLSSRYVADEREE